MDDVLQNFVGKLGSKSSQAVVTTLLKAFGRCRAFHDALDSIPDQRFQDEYMNMVKSTLVSGSKFRIHASTGVFLFDISVAVNIPSTN